ncbi:hypothetical protein NC653_006962 [Populus alba x Populus x berolinensis]|uniref:Uncharacterized protein n=1 Tax=Populus alba x Populus x berolinensis TaxID=444605 RepID=A0AAD6WD96_9ROSI|nr:hypothetical protein NC653_006962 [Populus alba x Populus x berolinensis]
MQNCKCSFDSAPLHRSLSKFQVPVSHSPNLPGPFPLSPFPNNLKNHFLPIRSILGETKVNSAILHRQRSIPGLHSWTALLYFQYWDTRKAYCILV